MDLFVLAVALPTVAVMVVLARLVAGMERAEHRPRPAASAEPLRDKWLRLNREADEDWERRFRLACGLPPVQLPRWGVWPPDPVRDPHLFPAPLPPPPPFDPSASLRQQYAAFDDQYRAQVAWSLQRLEREREMIRQHRRRRSA